MKITNKSNELGNASQIANEVMFPLHNSIESSAGSLIGVVDTFQRHVPASHETMREFIAELSYTSESILERFTELFQRLLSISEANNSSVGLEQCYEQPGMSQGFTTGLRGASGVHDVLKQVMSQMIIYGDGKKGRLGNDFDLDPIQAFTARQEVLDGTRKQLAADNRHGIASVERQLIQLGYAVDSFASGGKFSFGSTADGIGGSGLERAITQFQSDNNLEATGAIDAKTLRTLDAVWHQKVVGMTLSDVSIEASRMNGVLTPGKYREGMRQAIGEAAGAYNMDPAFLYGLLHAESSGGLNTRPRFEQRHFNSLQTMRDSLSRYMEEFAQLNEQLHSTLPEAQKAATVRIKELWQAASESKNLASGVLRSMVSGSGTSEEKLAALRTMAELTDCSLRELSTSWGMGQIMGWHTMNNDWQKQSGLSQEQLLKLLQTSGEKNQIALLLSFIRFNGLLSLAQQGDCERFAARYKGAHDPKYIEQFQEGMRAWGQF